MKKITIKRIVFVAIFAAISSILYYFPKFPLPIFPTFLEINFSMIPIIIATFMLGPIEGVIAVVVRFVVKAPMSNTAYVGELADLILGTITVLSGGFMYKYYKGKHKTLLSFILVIISWIIAAVVSNAFITIPFYVTTFWGGEWDKLIAACSDGFNLITFNHAPALTRENIVLWYVLLAVIPFNLILSSTVVGITASVHKRLKYVYDKIDMK